MRPKPFICIENLAWKTFLHYVSNGRVSIHTQFALLSLASEPLGSLVISRPLSI
tara:strand:+ start:6239 stop:6400 length:162 start_codon:yes stop_codon:yes gene_type:complete